MRDEGDVEAIGWPKNRRYDDAGRLAPHGPIETSLLRFIFYVAVVLSVAYAALVAALVLSPHA
jgi:hypothetical protein